MLTDYILTLEALQVTQIQPNFPYSKMGNVSYTIENSKESGLKQSKIKVLKQWMWIMSSSGLVSLSAGSCPNGEMLAACHTGTHAHMLVILVALPTNVSFIGSYCTVWTK